MIEVEEERRTVCMVRYCTYGMYGTYGTYLLQVKGIRQRIVEEVDNKF